MSTTVPTPTATSPPFAGWFKPAGGRWGKIVEAASHASAYDALLDTTRTMSGDLCVLPIGKHPDGGHGPRGAAK